jgi:hypothetical protein
MKYPEINLTFDYQNNLYLKCLYKFSSNFILDNQCFLFINKFMVNVVQTWSSDLSVNGGRCLRKKWLNPGIRNGTKAKTLTIDMTWSLLGYAFLTWNWAYSSSFIFLLIVGYWYISEMIRWGGKIFGCSLLSQNFWTNSFRNSRMMQMVSYFRWVMGIGHFLMYWIFMRLSLDICITCFWFDAKLASDQYSNHVAFSL